MYPEQTPQQQPIPITPSTAPKNRSKRTVLALWLMIGPTTLIIVTFILFALLNWVFGATIPAPTSAEGELFAESSTPLIITLGNVLLFLAGAISVITFLPGLIIGIVLLATRK
jgi:hypothetical protein